MKRESVTFNSEGKFCAAWLYVPDNLNQPAPAIVMAHGFSLVKEAFLDRYADIFCKNGFVYIVVSSLGRLGKQISALIEVKKVNANKVYAIIIVTT